MLQNSPVLPKYISSGSTPITEISKIFPFKLFVNVFHEEYNKSYGDFEEALSA